MHAALDAIASDRSLLDPLNYAGRLDALEVIESCVLDPADTLIAAPLERQFQTLNAALIDEIRREIREGGLRAARFRSRIEGCGFDLRDAPHRTGGYDGLDTFVSDLLLEDPVPGPDRALEAEMVQYQPAPARVVTALIAEARVEKDDVLIDVGSGLGQVPMLVNLLTDARTTGVELDPAYCDYARRRALALNLHDVVFRNDDARTADYSEGTVFFLYTPVTGATLQAVLERIRAAGYDRPIRVLTYGPCTEAAASVGWLTSTGMASEGPEPRGSFVSTPAVSRTRRSDR